jgi:hypothetical protein
MVRGATGARRDARRAGASAAGDAMDAGGVEGLGEGQRRQDGGQPASQPRGPHPRWTEEEDVVGSTPVLASASPLTLEGQAATLLE